MNTISNEDIQTTLKVLATLENIAYKKFDTDKALLYCDKVQRIECDVRHINEILKEVM